MAKSLNKEIYHELLAIPHCTLCQQQPQSHNQLMISQNMEFHFKMMQGLLDVSSVHVPCLACSHGCWNQCLSIGKCTCSLILQYGTIHHRPWCRACSTRYDFSLIYCSFIFNKNLRADIVKHTIPCYCLVLIMTG